MKTLLKILACEAVFLVSMMVAGAVITVLHLPWARIPNPPAPGVQFLLSALSGLVLIVGMIPQASGLAGSKGARATALIAFLALALGVNTMIEGSAFTPFFRGAMASTALLLMTETILLGLALGFWFGGAGTGRGFVRRGIAGRVGQVVLAWIAFPVCYFVFGMCVAPIVMPYYRAGLGGLQLPHLQTLLEVQLIRSVIFLLASLPLIVLWKGSRRALWLSLGLALTAAVGLFGLVGSTFFPPVLRVTHSIEIAADSFAYAAVLVYLFAAPSGPVPAPATAPVEEKEPALHA